MDCPRPRRRRWRFRGADGGGSLIEYAIWLFPIGMVASIAIGFLGGQVSESFGEVSTVFELGPQEGSGTSGGGTGEDHDDDHDDDEEEDDDH